jgi:cytochrome P450
MSRIAYHVMVEATFGDLAGSGDMGAALRDPMRRAFQFAGDQLNGKRGDVRAFHGELAAIHDTIGRMIASVRKAAAAGTLDDRQRASPIVRLILDGSRDGGMDEGFIPSFVVAFIFGGHETTGFSMAWALYELGRNPDLLAAILEEIDAFAAAHGGRPVAPAQYDERPYTLALIHELGRRHPPIHTTPRTALEAGEVPADPATGIGGFRYPKDALLLSALAGAHMDPDTYPDPRAFRVDRFLVGVTPNMSLTERGRQVQATARRLEEEFRLLPFSSGLGGCVGRGFNTLEVFMVLDELLRRFTFELEDAAREVTESDGAISGPGPGQVRVRIRRRVPRA